MSITVRQALKLEIFKEAKIIAGESGLENIINKVSVIEFPLNDFVFNTYQPEGDFYITGFFAYKDSPEQILDLVKLLIQEKSSGLCVIDDYIKEFSADVIEYANEYKLPIISIPGETPYANIITEIMEKVIENKDNTILAMRVDNLLEQNISEYEIRKLAFRINYQFEECIVVVYHKSNKNIEGCIRCLKSEIKKRQEYSMLKYKEGMLLIMTFIKNKETVINKSIENIVLLIKKVSTDYSVGISDIHENLGELKICIYEALAACDSAKYLNKGIVYYKDLGIYKLIIRLREDAELRKFRDSIIIPLKEYEKKYNMELLKTIRSFVKNEGNIIKVSQELYLHENTIRYRLCKVREILNMEGSDFSFYEQLSIALKADNVLID